VHVVYPGILLDGYAPAEAPPEPPVLGYLARMRPAKGLGLLAEAYVLLRRRERIPGLRLHVAGSCTAGDREFVREVRARLEQAGVADRVEFHANLDRDAKIAFLRGLSVLSVPTTYGESFGLYVIEALAAGVPVVQPRHAAFPEVIEATGGGLLCEPDEAESLAQRIEELLADPARARAMGLRGREVVRARFSVGEMVRGTLDVFRQALAARSATGGA
jgi:glycosyltransferase involved in cell wall biosynthesis